MKTNKSAPLTPLAPPAGITGTTLPDSPAFLCKCRKCGHVHDWLTRVREESHGSYCPECGDILYDRVSPASPVKDTPACPQTYFQSDVVAMVGDRISAGSMGDCKVLELTSDGYLLVQNLFTKETAHVFASDCDLVDRPVPASPVESVGAVVSYNNAIIRGGSGHGSAGTGAGPDAVLEIWNGSQLVASVSFSDALSHAAKDAKIRELQEALDNLLESICDEDGEPLPGLVEPEAVKAARAALAIPCAPLGS